jgi:outer membrane biosynthesis protein TonB
MTFGKTSLAAAMLALLLFGNGCDMFGKKKPAPPPAIPPSIDHAKIDLPQPEPTPPPSPNPAPPIQPTPTPTKQKPKRTKPPKKVVVQPEAEPETAPTTTTAAPAPAKPAPDPSLNAPMTNAQAQRQKQQTSDLLGTAEGNLSSLHRSLNADEQQMVSQIRNYIAQSRKAMTDGDLERAYNLANKANLLSSELVKQ